MARTRADVAQLSNLVLRTGNAESPELMSGGPFDAATARWGLMYMADPVLALENVRRALTPGGVLVAAFWAEAERVPYHRLPRRLLARHCVLPLVDDDSPGVFRYANVDRVQRDLGRAGFVIDVVEEMHVDVFEAADASSVIAWYRAFGMTRLLNDLPRDVQNVWEQEVTRELEQTRSEDLIRIGGVTRIVRGHPAG